MLGVWQLIKDTASGLAAFFRAREKKLDLDNDPAIKANEEAKQREAIREESTAEVAKDDLGQIQKDVADQ